MKLASENIPSPACLIVFVKSKTENQLIRFVIAYLVADNKVKCETVVATRDPRLHHSRPMASYTVFRKKTPTHSFFHISMNNVSI